MSEKMEDGGPAFPRPDWNGSWVGPDTFSGLSLRDWFAGQALAGMVGPWTEGERAAALCYQIADAMLTARKETP
jgi:hypothetical protein